MTAVRTVTFTKDFRYQADALTSVLYRADRPYRVSSQVESAARAVGALKEKTSGGSRRRPRKVGVGPSAG